MVFLVPSDNTSVQTYKPISDKIFVWKLTDNFFDLFVEDNHPDKLMFKTYLSASKNTLFHVDTTNRVVRVKDKNSGDVREIGETNEYLIWTGEDFKTLTDIGLHSEYYKDESEFVSDEKYYNPQGIQIGDSVKFSDVTDKWYVVISETTSSEYTPFVPAGKHFNLLDNDYQNTAFVRGVDARALIKCRTVKEVLEKGKTKQ